MPDTELHEDPGSPAEDPDQFCTDMNVDEVSCKNEEIPVSEPHEENNIESITSAFD